MNCAFAKVGNNMGEQDLDYKEEIFKLIQNISDEKQLAYLFFFIKNKIKAED